MDAFHRELKKLRQEAPTTPCIRCGEMWPTSRQPLDPNVSSHPSAGTCEDCIRFSESRPFNWANMMHPGVVPPQLEGLTDVEELLIGVWLHVWGPTC